MTHKNTKTITIVFYHNINNNVTYNNAETITIVFYRNIKNNVTHNSAKTITIILYHNIHKTLLNDDTVTCLRRKYGICSILIISVHDITSERTPPNLPPINAQGSETCSKSIVAWLYNLILVYLFNKIHKFTSGCMWSAHGCDNNLRSN